MTLNSIAALMGAVTAVIAAVITGFFSLRGSRTQVEVAEVNKDRDIELQNKRIFDQNITQHTSLLLGKLDEIHNTMSRISRQYSQTSSHMDWTDRLSRTDFRKQYKDDCASVEKCVSAVDIYLAGFNEHSPQLRAAIQMVLEEMNIYWGNQEELLRNDDIENEHHKAEHRGHHIGKIIKASKAISNQVAEVHCELRNVADFVDQHRRIFVETDRESIRN